MDPLLIKRIVEAALLASSQPLTVAQLNGLFPLDEPAPEGGIGQALEALQAECADRGVELVEVASGWRYQVNQGHAWVDGWDRAQVNTTRARSRPGVIGSAIRSPRRDIEQFRGGANETSSGEKRRSGSAWSPPRQARDGAGTTKGFLDYFGLRPGERRRCRTKDFGDRAAGPRAGGEAAATSATPRTPRRAMPLGESTRQQDAESTRQRNDTDPIRRVDATDAGTFRAIAQRRRR